MTGKASDISQNYHSKTDGKKKIFLNNVPYYSLLLKPNKKAIDQRFLY